MPSKQKPVAAQANNIQNCMATPSKQKAKVHKVGKLAKSPRTTTVKPSGTKTRSSKTGIPNDSTIAPQEALAIAPNPEHDQWASPEEANPSVAISPSVPIQEETQAPTEPNATAVTAPFQVSPEGSRRPQPAQPNLPSNPKTTRFKEDVLSVTIPTPLTDRWHRVTSGISVTKLLPFDRAAFEDPQSNTRLTGGNSLMKSTSLRHAFQAGKLEAFHAEDVVTQCQPKECPTNSIFY